MFLIIGALVVIGSVAGGYLMEGGHPLVLNQPAEFIIIGGSAIGSLLIGTPPSVLGQLVGQLKKLFQAPAGASDYGDLLAMLYQIFKLAQQSGVTARSSRSIRNSWSGITPWTSWPTPSG